NRGVRRREQQQGEYDANNYAESVSERGPKRAAHENLSHVAQHIIAHTLSPGRVDVAVDGLQTAERVHGETEQRGEETNFDHYPQNCGSGSFAHGGLCFGTAGIESHHTSGVGNSFDTGKREDDSDKAGPVLPETAMQRL